MIASSHKFVSWIPLLILAASLSVVSASGQASMRGAAPMAVAQEGMVKLTGSNIEYFSQRQGEPIVLLPFGGGLTVGYMDELSQDLADAGYRVVRINFRGSGKSTGSGENVTLHTLADDFAGVTLALKLERVNIAGHAFGNRVARTLAADHSELVHRVILFAVEEKFHPSHRENTHCRRFQSRSNGRRNPEGNEIYSGQSR